MNRKHLLRILILLVLLVLAACSQPAGSPEAVIEQYLSALVNGDNLSAVNLSCSAWEANANAEGAAFEGVDVGLEGMSCSVVEQDGGDAVVACQGQILFSYAGGETEQIDLGRRSYLAIQQNGEWRMCGYQ